MAQGKVKSMADRENVRAFIAFVRSSGFPHKIKITNYTTEIQSDLFNRYFMQTSRGKSCFAAYSKLKRDVAGVAPPDIDKGKLHYFAHDFRKDLEPQTVLNLDLKSAYATALYNAGCVSEDTALYLGKIPKLDRLAAVGMLASKKHVFEYDEKGKLSRYYKEVAPTENFFYLAVHLVQNIMDELKAICGQDYLFTWVDGIYFKPREGLADELIKAAEEAKYRCTLETLNNFRVSIGSKVIHIDFDKDGKEKRFKIPAAKNTLANELINFLTYKK